MHPERESWNYASQEVFVCVIKTLAFMQKAVCGIPE